eukprot:sb/3463008/
MLTKDHHYGQPINTIFYHPEGRVMSACKRSFKIWDGQTGEAFTAIESEEDICHVAWHEGTGMFFFAKEAQKMGTFYIPAVGPAPKWCSFLDSITEELEESTENVVYDDYKFVTSEELESLGLSHLTGTSYLRAYMHGYFIHMKLYRATGSQVFRLNLCKGTFMKPIDTLTTGVSSKLYVVNSQYLPFFVTLRSRCNKEREMCHVHLLIVFSLLSPPSGTETGTVECWDPRSRTRCATLSVPSAPQITALQTNNILDLAVGTEDGKVHLYDIRSPQVMLTKDHHYGQPINTIFYHPEGRVMSACKRSFKIWDGQTGEAFTAIESEEDICHVAWHEGTGMFFFAKEAQKMGTFYIPAVGPAPKWCSFLDSITEELEESTENVVYDDYKFVTSEELESLGLSHLTGTSYLRAYMHGYFIHMKLYREARDIVQPFAFSEYKERKVKEKLAVPDRIEKRALPKINKNLAAKDLHKGGALMADDRFGSLFTDSNFQVDEDSEQFKLINPTVRKLTDQQKSGFEEVSAVGGDSEEEEEEEVVKPSRGKRAMQMKLVSCENESKIFAVNTSSVSLPLGSRIGAATGEMVAEPEESTRQPRRDKSDDGRERRQLGRSAAPFLKKQRGKFWRGRKVG